MSLVKIPPRVEAEKRYGVVIGRRVKFPKNQEFDEIWCFGDCGVDEAKKITTRFPHLKERIRTVRGCPPLDWWRGQTIDKELRKKG